MIVQSLYFHVDLDAFFAAVEQLDNPQWRGKPVIVGGEPGKRGVVSTCSYEARKYGVHSAMPMKRAVELCPHAIFTRGRMHRYHEKSREVMNVFSRFTPEVQQISVDEAFLTMTGTERLFGPAEVSAQALKDAVRSETGLTVSVGAASNRYIAKIASGLSKPDGLVIVKPGEEAEFMKKLPLKKVWGVGEKTRNRLEAAGLLTVTDLLSCPQSLLSGLLGKGSGEFLYTILRGQDPGIFTGESASRSISSERTFEVDIFDTQALETMLLELSQDIMYRLLNEGLHSKTVHLKIRYQDFSTVSVQETFEASINDSEDLFKKAKILLAKKLVPGEGVRLIGLGVQNVREGKSLNQIDLFDTGENEKKRKVEEALHRLAQKRGKKLVTKARLITREDADE